ncbi:nitroreductase family deazaflavin-dependent oxidoreductase [Dactylosporangium sp. CA-092794]|uniref:nitroreductase family deazaflavin-dependent oxidoreductase n=1 Tax=Dactylosporangium sp. CA-092794 TaxID=3239929 RepID=UPI003D91652E
MDLAEVNRGVIAEFRANGGKVGGRFAGAHVLLLHTVGARSGEERINPVGYTSDGGDMVVVASFGGAPVNPAWYHNLKANPRIVVEVGTETLGVVASEVPAEDYERVWAVVTAAMPGMADYRTMTTRRLPVIRLTAVDR